MAKFGPSLLELYTHSVPRPPSLGRAFVGSMYLRALSRCPVLPSRRRVRLGDSCDHILSLSQAFADSN